MAADGAKDDDGYSIVIVQATGHHTGKAFTLGGKFPPVWPSFSAHNINVPNLAIYMLCKILPWSVAPSQSFASANLGQKDLTHAG
jgi:hypothetical protein